MAGTRDEKKRATRARITEAGLRLFLERGYDATTIDALADAAGISRRTFFSYFASKDEVLLAWHGGGALSSALGPALLERPSDEEPLRAAERCLVDLASRYETEESRAMDRLLRSSETLEAVKDAAEVRMERDLAEAMSVKWPDPERRLELRVAAMVAIGALRLALDDWRHDRAGTPLATHLRSTFRVVGRSRRATTERRGPRTSGSAESGPPGSVPR